MIEYVRWDNVPDNLKTKTQLKEMRLKPIDEDNPDAIVKYQFDTKWKRANLYDVSKTKEIKKRIVKDIAITPDNIAQSLYVINKSAKKSRDTKNLNYDLKRHSVVHTAKTRQQKLYHLKDQALKKAIKEEYINYMGIHKQIIQHDECFSINYLKLYKFNDYTFHIPIGEHEVVKSEILGEIGVISSEHRIKTTIGFNEAEKLLRRYVDGE